MPRIRQKQKLRQQKAPASAGVQAIRAPAARGHVVRNTPAGLKGGPVPGSITIRHREFIQDVSLNAGIYEAIQFRVNPGDPNTFPWLAQLAVNYETYVFKRLSFSLQTENPTTARGYMGLSPDYDAQDEAPISKAGAMAYASAVRSPAWGDCTLQCRPADLATKGKRYVREDETIPTGTDVRLYDCANMHVISGGATSGLDAAELYVEYEVQLFTPQLRVVASSADYTVNDGLPLDPLLPVHFQGEIPEHARRLYTFVTDSSSTARQIQFLTSGIYRITSQVEGTATVSGFASLFSEADAISLLDFYDADANPAISGLTAAATVAIILVTASRALPATFGVAWSMFSSLATNRLSITKLSHFHPVGGSVKAAKRYAVRTSPCTMPDGSKAVLFDPERRRLRPLPVSEDEEKAEDGPPPTPPGWLAVKSPSMGA